MAVDRGDSFGGGCGSFFGGESSWRFLRKSSKDKLVLERFEVNTDGPNLLEGDVTFRRMGLYTK